MSSSINRYVTIKEAAEIAAKSETTIRRFIRNLVSGPPSERRDLVKPGYDELIELKKQNGQFEYLISRKLLEQEYGIEEQQSAGSADDFLEFLKSQIAEKDRVIAQQNQQLQSQLLVMVKLSHQLPSPAHNGIASQAVPTDRAEEEDPDSEIVNVEGQGSDELEETTKVTDDVVDTVPVPPVKRRFLSWIRG